MIMPERNWYCGQGQYTAPGFSLIELLVAMTILSIVISIALPPLRQHLMQARRTEATTTLERMDVKDHHHCEERYYDCLHHHEGAHH